MPNEYMCRDVVKELDDTLPYESYQGKVINHQSNNPLIEIPPIPIGRIPILRSGQNGNPKNGACLRLDLNFMITFPYFLLFLGAQSLKCMTS
jgi:hypothetical protein